MTASAARSLAARVLVGALLWTLGLLVVASAALAALMEHRGRAAVLVHGVLGHTVPMGLLALALLVAGAWYIRRGFASVTLLRARLVDVRQGRAVRVLGRYPTEVQPVVDDLNALLEARERMVRRAQATAGDLAHGLKTPLAVLMQDVARASAEGHGALADAIGAQAIRIQQQIDYQLARARATAQAGPSAAPMTDLAEVVTALARTLTRLHEERGIAIEVRRSGDVEVRCEREDLDEMLGNLMDNACKWARRHVVVVLHRGATEATVYVDDDGPGVDLAQHQAVLARGVRLDEAVPGAGLGLAIVHDLVERYGGRVQLERSPLGGASARLVLPLGPGASGVVC